MTFELYTKYAGRVYSQLDDDEDDEISDDSDEDDELSGDSDDYSDKDEEGY